ncbi:unnamed protein product, partial [Rotaria magnacalcarata]
EKWSYTKAGAHFKIPLGTLSFHVLKLLNANIGYPTALACEEERYLVDLIVTLQDWGQLFTHNDVWNYTQEYVEIMNLQSRFAGGAPTRDWYQEFLKRWKTELEIMFSSSLENVRVQGATSNIIDGWFKVLHAVLKKLNLLEKPQSIFNMDKSGFNEEAGRQFVVVKRGTKYANQKQGSCGKDFTTVILTISANGVCLPPYIIYKSLRLYSQWCPKNLIKGTVYNGTKSGWTDEHCLFDYLQNLFIPNTKSLPKPLLLIFDGHYSHLSIKAVRLAIQNGIHLLCLPSHSTHLLQPLDVYTLKYVKQQWKQLLWERNTTTSKSMEKTDCVRLFSKLYEYALIPGHCSTAFAKTGIFPYDSRAIKNDTIIKNTLSTIVGTPEQYAHILSNKLHTSSCLNVQTMVPRNTLVRSNSAPDLFIGKFLTGFLNSCFILVIIDHSISTTTSQLELNPTGSGDDIENDAQKVHTNY